MRIRNRHDVAKAWATQAKPEGKAASMFFDGNIIFSYGRHFPIARLVTLAKSCDCGRHSDCTRCGGRGILETGEVVALFTTRDYSVTTQRHKTLVASALQRQGIRIFDVDDVLSVGARNWVDIMVRASKHDEKAKRARKHKEYHVGQAASLRAMASDYATTFNLNPDALSNA